jgi:RNA polymerase sigma factor (TIGR02999 family)
MAVQSTQEITHLLRAWEKGDQAALDQLIPIVHEDLRRAAHRYMARERPGHTLQTSALVNEVYLRLVDLPKVRWQDRAHFFAICARLMRRTLTDFARSRLRLKRGGPAPLVSFDEALKPSREPIGRPVNLLALDDALNGLAVFDCRKSQVVELRFFGGLSVKETAEALGISERTVMNDWKLAKAWLVRELTNQKRDGT